MKRLKIMSALLFLLAAPLFVWVNVAHAQHFSPSISSDQVIRGSVYAAGKNVDIRGTIYGDVYCAGSKVTISATIYGDVICTGSQIVIDGTIDGNVRAAGQIIELHADVARSVTLAGFGVVIDAKSKIGQDATIVSSNATLKGDITRDAITSGSKVVVEGSIGRNLIASNDAVEIQGKGRILGDLHYSSKDKNAVKTSGEALIVGKTNYQEHVKKDSSRAFSPIFFLIMVLGSTIIAMLLAGLFPLFLERTSSRLKTNMLKSFVAGLLFTLVLPAATFVLIVSFIGLPLVMLLLLAVMFGAWLSLPIVGYRVGQLLMSTKRPVLIAAAGTFALASAYFLPFLGLILVCLVYFMGFGALLLELWPYAKKRPTETLVAVSADNVSAPKAKKSKKIKK